VPADRMAVPAIDAWSINELLAHLTGWDELATRDLDRLEKGGTPALATFHAEETDAWNVAHLRLRQGLPAPQAVAESDQAWSRLAEALQAASEALFAPDRLAGRYGEITVRHKQQHADEVRRWRRAQGI